MVSNYELVISAARRYWNACLPLMTHPIERELLQEPVSMILQCIGDTIDKNKFKKLQVKQRLNIFLMIDAGKTIPKYTFDNKYS